MAGQQPGGEMSAEQRRGKKMLRGALISVAMLAVLLAIYLVSIVWRVGGLLQGGGTLSLVLGASLLIFVAIAFWAIQREIRFGIAATKLSRLLDAEGGVLDLEISADPSGRANRAEAREKLAELEKATETEPDKWQNWQRLGIVRRAAGNDRGARQAIRTAITLHRQQNR
ncbi:MAG: hypothetical protein Q4C71_03465 [Microbacteriaceae bacterium]|nr:hypothetical protein [Microbacteriaceae bacterium]